MFSKTLLNETVDTGDVEGIAEIDAFSLEGVNGVDEVDEVVGVGVGVVAEDGVDDEGGSEEIYNRI